MVATALAGSLLFLVPGAQAFDWDGRHYVGSTLGVVLNLGSIDWTFYDTYDGTIQPGGTGWLLGVTTGVNFKLDGNTVVGIEGDASIADLFVSGDSETDWYSLDFEDELSTLLTLRARYGLLTDDEDTLFYVTGGLAAAQVSSWLAIEGKGENSGQIYYGQTSGLTFGVIGGVGAEHAISDDVTVKGEILGYLMQAVDGPSYSGKGDSGYKHNVSGIILRTGINFHF